jgi:hypothetical protein
VPGKDEVRAYLKKVDILLKESTIDKLLEHGEIKCFKKGRRFVLKRDILEYIGERNNAYRGIINLIYETEDEIWLDEQRLRKELMSNKKEPFLKEKIQYSKKHVAELKQLIGVEFFE